MACVEDTVTKTSEDIYLNDIETKIDCDQVGPDIYGAQAEKSRGIYSLCSHLCKGSYAPCSICSRLCRWGVRA
jgi:hypothetical protein